MDRYQKAILKYAILNKRIKIKTSRLAAIPPCSAKFVASSSGFPFLNQTQEHTCLELYWKHQRITLCKHCSKALVFINQRKILRRKFARAKQTITLLGNKLIQDINNANVDG